MTPEELIKQLVAAGGWFERSGERHILKGEIPDALRAALRDQRDAVLEAWDTYQRNRYGKTPPEDHPLGEVPVWTQGDYRRIEGYVRRQGDEVQRWVFRRAEVYAAHHPEWNLTQRLQATLRDVLHWQLGRYQRPEELLATFEWVQNAPWG